MSDSNEWPSRFVDLKHELVSGSTEEHLTASWNDLLAELAKRTTEIAQAGTDFIPQVNFADLEKLTPEELNVIKRKGTVVIRDIVDSKTASGWKAEIDEFIKANPHAGGFPEGDKQFWDLFWTRSQVQARTHPNVMKASTWINKLFHIGSGKTLEGVDLSVPLTYADRFRIRLPGRQWTWLPPHIDGGGIERWEDKAYRGCYKDIFSGNWRQHDPYDVEHRVDARRYMYNQRGQITVFRAFQGWMAMTEIAPTQGTLRVFPYVKLSNAYLMLRPFFRPTVPLDSPDILDPKNWKFDISTPDFPSIIPMDGGYTGPLPSTQLHPHLRLEETMPSVPKVKPGDMVFWHCDTVHSVEQEHTGDGDSAVMYIAAVPKTPLNSAYVAKQAEAFLEAQHPPDANRLPEGTTFVGIGVDADIKDPISRVAMGLPIKVA